jgi:uncharacterized membrane protein HdeD (DUF308 family)
MKESKWEIFKTLVKAFFTSSKTKTWGWTILNGTLLLVVGFLADLQPTYGNATWLVVSVAVLNAITKYINKTYL